MDAPRWFDVAPVIPGREAEIAADLRRLARETCIDSVAFMCPLLPEGDPPVDKAAAFAPRVAAMKKRLEGAGLRVGVLVQSTMGHGYEPDSPAPFRRLELRDGRRPFVYCPLDAGFRARVRSQVARLVAETRPDFLVVDDDTRLGSGYGGCLCPLHRAALAERTGAAELSFEALAATLAVGADPALQRAFDETQADSMERFFRDLRAGVDEADPSLPVVLCSCGYEMPLAPRFAKILAAPGQRPAVRLNNGRYVRETLRDIPFWLHGTAWQLAQTGPDADVLCEPDTCPHNRYATPAAILHYHLCMSLLEGCDGAKFWITNLHDWEPASGEAYRRLLARNKALYPALAALEPVWEGVRVPLAATAAWGVDWGSSMFGRFGFPYANVRAPAGGTLQDAPPGGEAPSCSEALAASRPWALSAHDVLVLSDAELRAILRGRALLDGGAAIELAKRGFAALTGVDARERGDLPRASCETWDGGGVNRGIPDAADLRAHDPAARPLSTLLHRVWEHAPEAEPIGPGALLFDNAEGGRVLTVAFRLPTLDRDLGHYHAWGETRKRFLARLLDGLCGGDRAAWSGGAFFPGDADLLFRAGRAADGTRLWAALRTSLDPLEELPLSLAGPPPALVERLAPDATWEPVPFETTPDGVVLRLRLLPAEPAVLRVSGRSGGLRAGGGFC
ncbi:MAG: hypothetical protein IJV65_05650 [Kiritimatiellae bacterium]|nr:hypothetical protein [Kiritimatiellia bacterium]